MKVLLGFISCFLCLKMTLSNNGDSYKAAVILNGVEGATYHERYGPLITESAQMKADIVVIPSVILKYEEDNYDEIIKFLSQSAKSSGLYLAANFLEMVQCDRLTEKMHSGVVLDRRGDTVLVYRRPLNHPSSCNATYGFTTFTADFGVNFSILSQNSLVLENLKNYKEKNYILIGSGPEYGFWGGGDFLSSWAYSTKSNLLSIDGIFSEGLIQKNEEGTIAFAELGKNGASESEIPLLASSGFYGLLENSEDFTMKYLNAAESINGLQQTVCHDGFCCDFYAKTQVNDKDENCKYGLFSYSGSTEYNKYDIGMQTCAVVLINDDSRSCDAGVTSQVSFEKLMISSESNQDNFLQYPVISVSDKGQNKGFSVKSIKKHNKFILEINNIRYLQNVATFNRVYLKDSIKMNANTDFMEELYGFVLSDNVVEFFDYLWIRVRIPIFIISIYVLEMM